MIRVYDWVTYYPNLGKWVGTVLVVSTPTKEFMVVSTSRIKVVIACNLYKKKVKKG